MAEQNHSGTGHNITAEGDVFINSIHRLTSDLASVVNALSKKIFVLGDDNDNISVPFNPQIKIEYNNVIKFKIMIWINGKHSCLHEPRKKLTDTKSHIRF